MRGMRGHDLRGVHETDLSKGFGGQTQRMLAELCGSAGGGVDLDCRLVRTLQRHVGGGDLLVWFERENLCVSQFSIF